MHYLALIIGICWIVFWVYWIVSAFRSKRGSSPKRLNIFMGIRLVVLVVAAVLAIIFNRLPALFREHALDTGVLVSSIGLIVFLLGLVLAVSARRYLGQNWGMPMTQKHESELITSGPYSYVRHPIYTGILLMALGSAIDVNSYWLLVLIVASVYFVYSAFVEERLMQKQFPKTYPAYKRGTKMLLPFIF